MYWSLTRRNEPVHLCGWYTPPGSDRVARNYGACCRQRPGWWSMVWGSKSSLLSSAVFFSAKFAQLGEDAPPNRWTLIWYSSGWLSRFLSGHYRKLRASQSLGRTRTWGNIASTSYIRAVWSSVNLESTPTRELVRSGACKSWSFEWGAVMLGWTIEDCSHFTRFLRVEYGMMGKIPAGS